MKTTTNLLCLLAIGLCGVSAYAGFPLDFAPPPPPCPADTCCPPGSGGSGGSGGPGGFGGGGCSTCRGGGPGGGGGSIGASGATGGMPDWKVNEPNIDLRLHDEPLAYQSSVARVSFQIDYWQRDDRTPSANVFTLGAGWECSWQSYIDTDGTTYDPVTLYGTSGGEIQFSDLSGATPNYYYNLRMLSLTDTNGNLSGFDVFYPSGAEDVYCFLATAIYGNVTQAYLSQKIDEHGHTTAFVYEPFNPTTGLVQLNYVIDPDGKTNTLSYTTNASYNCLISQVQDPYGHTASFAYDTNGYLTNVTDEAGLSSSFGYADVAVGNEYFYYWYGYYETNHWLDQLTTPYGTTSFSFTDEGLEIDPWDMFYLIYYGDLSSILRSVVVTEPNGSHQMFAYNSYVTFAWNNVNTTNIPSSTPDGSLLDDGAYLVYRNSYYWGRQQFANLSPTFLATGATNWDLTLLTTNDFLNGRWQHWLHSSGGGQSDALSMEQDPSPDGSTPGEMTWFTYPGQPPGYVYDLYGNQASYFQGTSISPTLKIKVLPDGTQWYQQYQLDQWGNKTNVISTYTMPGGSVGIRTNSYVYASNGVDLLQSIGADGVTTAAIAYDDSHQPLSVTNALGEVTSYTYNGNEQPASITQPNGLVTTSIYGADGFLAQQIAIGYSTNSYTYTNGLVYTHTDERGLTVTNSWDALQRLTQVAYPDGTSIAYSYNNLDLAKVVDRMGSATGYGYNAIRQKIFETNALGNVTSYTYCDCGALEAITNALGNVTQFVHDNQGNLVSVAYPDGYGVTNQYNLLRQLIQRTDSSGAVLNYIFNNQGLQTTISNRVGQVAAYAFDIDDRPTNAVDANGVSVGVAYDNLGRLLARSYPDGGADNYGYTPNVSGVTSYTNPIGNVTLFGFDALNRKISEAHPGMTTNQFAYNGAGDLLVLTDGKNQTTRWLYDSFGRVTNKVDALNRIIFIYAFDANSRLTNRWTPENGNAFYAFDSVGNTTQICYPQQTNSYSYDALNRLTNMVDAAGTTTRSYTPAGFLASEGGLWSGDTVSMGYTNRLRNSLSIGSSWSQSYGYDLERRLTQVASPGGAFNYNYQFQPASPLVTEIGLPNGATITNFYDPMAHLTQTSLNNHWGHTLDSYAYDYDLASERTNIVRNLGLTSSTVTAKYDSMGELTSWNANETNGTPRQNEQLAWAYDAAGNLRLRTNGGLVQTFAVDAVNELTNITRTGVLTLAGATPAPATNVTVNGLSAQIYGDFVFAATNLSLANGNNTFTNVAVNLYGVRVTNTLTVNLPQSVNLGFDANGNLTNDSLHSLAYDAENQLTNVTVANNFKEDFAYDGLNRLRIKREYSWSGSAWIKINEIRFIWDGDVIVQLRDSNNVPTLTLTRGLDLSGSLQGAGGIDGLLAMTDGSGANYFYHADGNGNVTALIDAQENMVARREYDAFGRTINLSGNKAVVNPFWFSSQLHDETTDYYHYKYRVYSPIPQRWLNRDPIGEKGFEALRNSSQIAMNNVVNLYLFVANDALNYADPLGLTIWLCTRDVSGFPFIGNHAYLWNDKNNKPCGMNSSSGKGPRGRHDVDTGPGTPGQTCSKVEGSEGKEDDVMSCCNKNANNGPWIPGVHDCHNAADNCLEKNGLTPPEHNRLNQPPYVNQPIRTPPWGLH
jgi:RHS repeat-associated protein